MVSCTQSRVTLCKLWLQLHTLQAEKLGVRCRNRQVPRFVSLRATGGPGRQSGGISVYVKQDLDQQVSILNAGVLDTPCQVGATMGLNVEGMQPLLSEIQRVSNTRNAQYSFSGL